jgi:hypothetical protein
MPERSKNLLIRITPKEHRAWQKRAEAQGLTLSAWIRLRLNDDGSDLMGTVAGMLKEALGDQWKAGRKAKRGTK